MGVAYPMSPDTTVVVERDVEMTARDGTVLRANVWRPARPGRSPVLLQRTPYGKDDSYVSVWHAGLEPLRAVAGGYVVVVQDVRGRFASDGEFVPFVNERDDGYDTVEWASRLPYADGRVCMYGVSYVGYTQFAALASGHPALHAIAPHETSADAYEGWTYTGGAMQFGFALWWALALAQVNLDRAIRRSTVGVERARALRDELLAVQADPALAFDTRPALRFAALEEALPAYGDWLAHGSRDEYWERLSARAAIARPDGVVPALHIAGWNDVFLTGSLDAWSRMLQTAAGAPDRRQELIVGPWAHAVPLETIGLADYGPFASEAALDLTALHLDFFDRTLGRSTAPAPAPVRYFLMGANRWQTADTWPPAGTRCVPIFLTAEGGLSTTAPAAPAPPRGYVFDPTDPVPTRGGPTFLPGLFVGRNVGPQAPAPERPDVLTYCGDPLDDDLVLAGPVRARIWFATNVPSTDLTAKLIDISSPDNTALGLCDGIVRVVDLSGPDASVSVPTVEPSPGVPRQVTVELGPIAYRFRRGHRLRLDISSSNYPRFDVNPNTGEAPAAATTTRLAHQFVFSDSDHASTLELSALADGDQ